MEPGSFFFDGVDSRKYGMMIQTRPIRKPPQRRRVEATASNRSGTIYRDLGVYDNSELDLSLVFVTKPDIRTIDEIAALFDTRDYVDFIPYYEPESTYRVMVSETPEFNNLYHFANVWITDVKLSVYPFKYIVGGLEPISGGQELNLINQGIDTSPQITLVGHGDLRLTVNDIDYHFKNVDSQVTMDSEALTCTGEMVGLDYPTLEPGVNKLTTDADHIEVIPRYRRRAV